VGNHRDRIDDRATAWGIVIEHIDETENSVLAFGRPEDRAVTLKVLKQHEDELLAGAVLRAFAGKGVVRILDQVEGVLLLERLLPGESLVTLSAGGHDEAATERLAAVIGRFSPQACPGVPTVEQWGRSFEHYRARDDRSLPKRLVDEAHIVYMKLCASQRRRRLLHGDLHHGNVLRDSNRGWVAIDPKGVLGEPEYEIGAALRNPIEHPEVFLERRTIERRVGIFADRLQLDAERIAGWAFAQAVLATVWLREDGVIVKDEHPWLELAQLVQPMLR
jgi:streptomycin 6-kinase